MYKEFTVKSSIHDYNVKFVNDFKVTLQEKMSSDDVLILDQKVYDLYEGSLRDIIVSDRTIFLEASEKQKSFLSMAPIIEELLKIGFKKNNRLIAMGGGITQDVVAFLSQNMFRGVEWFFFPTTLLAQADSCIGGKSSINFGAYKNQLGNFYPPNEIYIDMQFLKTLSCLDIRSGLGEMMHFFILSSEANFELIKAKYIQSLTDFDSLCELIFRSLEIKKQTIEIDEFDQKERQVFNYGHSFGHALETITNYQVPHGVAVCHGMDIANYLSVQLGYVDSAFREKVKELLSLNWERGELGEINILNFISALKKDKKNIGKEVHVILTRGFGKMFKTSIDIEGETKDYIQKYLREEST